MTKWIQEILARAKDKRESSDLQRPFCGRDDESFDSSANPTSHGRLADPLQSSSSVRPKRRVVQNSVLDELLGLNPRSNSSINDSGKNPILKAPVLESGPNTGMVGNTSSTSRSSPGTARQLLPALIPGGTSSSALKIPEPTPVLDEKLIRFGKVFDAKGFLKHSSSDYGCASESKNGQVSGHYLFPRGQIEKERDLREQPGRNQVFPVPRDTADIFSASSRIASKDGIPGAASPTTPIFHQKSSRPPTNQANLPLIHTSKIGVEAQVSGRETVGFYSSEEAVKVGAFQKPELSKAGKRSFVEEFPGWSPPARRSGSESLAALPGSKEITGEPSHITRVRLPLDQIKSTSPPNSPPPSPPNNIYDATGKLRTNVPMDLPEPVTFYKTKMVKSIQDGATIHRQFICEESTSKTTLMHQNAEPNPSRLLPRFYSTVQERTLWEEEDRRTFAASRQQRLEEDAIQDLYVLQLSLPDASSIQHKKSFRQDVPDLFSSSKPRCRARLIARISSGVWTAEREEHVSARLRGVASAAAPHLPILTPFNNWEWSERFASCSGWALPLAAQEAWIDYPGGPVTANVDILVLADIDAGPLDPNVWAQLYEHVDHDYVIILIADALDNWQAFWLRDFVHHLLDPLAVIFIFQDDLDLWLHRLEDVGGGDDGNDDGDDGAGAGAGALVASNSKDRARNPRARPIGDAIIAFIRQWLNRLHHHQPLYSWTFFQTEGSGRQAGRGHQIAGHHLPLFGNNLLDSSGNFTSPSSSASSLSGSPPSSTPSLDRSSAEVLSPSSSSTSSLPRTPATGTLSSTEQRSGTSGSSHWPDAPGGFLDSSETFSKLDGIENVDPDGSFSPEYTPARRPQRGSYQGNASGGTYGLGLSLPESSDEGLDYFEPLDIESSRKRFGIVKSDDSNKKVKLDQEADSPLSLATSSKTPATPTSMVPSAAPNAVTFSHGSKIKSLSSVPFETKASQKALNCVFAPPLPRKKSSNQLAGGSKSPSKPSSSLRPTSSFTAPITSFGSPPAPATNDGLPIPRDSRLLTGGTFIERPHKRLTSSSLSISGGGTVIARSSNPTYEFSFKTSSLSLLGTSLPPNPHSAPELLQDDSSKKRRAPSGIKRQRGLSQKPRSTGSGSGGCDSCSHPFIENRSGPPLNEGSDVKSQLCQRCSAKWNSTKIKRSLSLSELKTCIEKLSALADSHGDVNSMNSQVIDDEPQLILWAKKHRPYARELGQGADQTQAFVRLLGSTPAGSCCQSCGRIRDVRILKRFPEIKIESNSEPGRRRGFDGAALCNSCGKREDTSLLEEGEKGGESFSNFSRSLSRKLSVFDSANKAALKVAYGAGNGGLPYQVGTAFGSTREAELTAAVEAANEVFRRDQTSEEEVAVGISKIVKGHLNMVQKKMNK